MSKRLAKKNTLPANAKFESPVEYITDDSSVSNVGSLKKSVTGAVTSEYNLYIVPYTEKSIVVMGDTLDHSSALVRLGGSFNTGLKVGAGWVFARVREESVKKYIQTGEIVPYTYKTPLPESVDKRKLVAEIFTSLKGAFDIGEEYTGESIHDVLAQIEKMHV